MSKPGSPNKTSEQHIKGNIKDIYARLDSVDNRGENFFSRIMALEKEATKGGDETSENLKALNNKIDSEVMMICRHSLYWDLV
jgi:hypothetical protein